MSTVEASTSGYRVKPLGRQTWDAFADLAERHNGVWGGCWCTWFHPSCADRTTIGNRAFKQRLVNEGRAHAALLFDGDIGRLVRVRDGRGTAQHPPP